MMVPAARGRAHPDDCADHIVVVVLPVDDPANGPMPGLTPRAAAAMLTIVPISAATGSGDRPRRSCAR